MTASIYLNEKVQAAGGLDASSQSLANVRPTGGPGTLRHVIVVSCLRRSEPFKRSGAGRVPLDQSTGQTKAPFLSPRIPTELPVAIQNSDSFPPDGIAVIKRVRVSLTAGRITNTGPAR